MCILSRSLVVRPILFNKLILETSFGFVSAKNCGPLRAPVNGSTIGNQFTFPNKISFQCDEGFILKGSGLRQCQANGVWTGNNTFCEGEDKHIH